MAEEDWLSKYEGDFQDNGEEEEEDPKRKPQKKKKRSAFFEDDAADEIEGGRRGSSAVNMQYTNAVSKLPSNTTIYPRVVKEAAQTLLSYDDYPFAHNGAFQTTLSLITTQPDDAMRVDPLVVLWYVGDTGCCLVYVRETIRLSEYLLLLVFHATFTIQITKSARLTGISIDDVNVKAATSDAQSEKASTFHTQEVLAALDMDPEVVEQVKYHMETLGPRDPADVCDPDFVSAQKEVVSDIVQGRYKAAQTFRKKRITAV